MMSYHSDKPKHTKLPSFTELTSNFASSSLSSKTDQIPRDQNVVSYPSHYSQQPQSAPAVEFHSAQPISYQFPPQQGFNNPFATNEQQHPSKSIVNEQRMIPKYSNRLGYDRRLSLQLPPYPIHHHHHHHRHHHQHSKHGSYDSQTSLNTLADVASSDSESQLLFASIEHTLSSFKSLNSIFNDINYDLILKLQNSTMENDGKRTFYEYSSDDKHNLDRISTNNLNSFLNEIPISALKDALEVNGQIHNTLERWLDFKSREKASNYTSNNTNNNNNGVDHEMVVVSMAPPSDLHNVDLKFNKFAGPLGPAQQPVASSSQQEQPTTKKRKPHGKKNDSNAISLVVKPSNPVSKSSDFKKPPTKGVFNEELSLKTDSRCRQCGSNDTPEWRRGPYGSRSLCNACGLFYGKLIKRFGFDEAALIMLRRRDQGHGDDRRIPIE